MAASSSSSFTEAADDDAGKAPPPSSSQQQQQQTAAASSFLSRSEDLVARAIAPVKPQYLLPPPTRPRNNNNNNNNNNKPSPAQDVAGDQHNNQGASDKKGGQAGGGIAVVVKEKKSKRQLKRERQQEKKSVKNLCPEVAKIGDAAACKYGSGCRFSHDLDGFLRQKPEDLPGTCPFENACDPCPYGVACRFLGTHHQHPAVAYGGNSKKPNSEVNVLSKDLQKLLWKDKVEYAKADAQLKLLGLLGGEKKYAKTESKQLAVGNSSFLNGSGILEENEGTELVCNSPSNAKCSPIVGSKENYVEDEAEARPPKKAKLPFDEECSAAAAERCVVHVESKSEEVMSSEFEKVSPHENLGSPRVEVIPTINLREKKIIDFRGKLYLAPLTTVGNLPFRRACKSLGADITCGEMAMCTNLLQGQASEWALVRRHSSEDLFGVQICGAYPDTVSRTVELIGHECSVDFIDINMGCPIDIVVNRGAGSALLTKPMRMKNIIQVAAAITDKPLTIKVRTGFLEGRNRIDSLLCDISNWGASMVTIHGRSRQQRYSKVADWDYIYKCARQAPDSLQILGNGDIFSYLDWNKHLPDCPQLSSCMIARGALIKPWIFTEIKEQRHWDITSGERLEIFKKYVNFGLEHWGSDGKGVETTRHFLLEWLSYTCRYVPVGLLDVIPQRLNWRPPSYFGRDSLETLMASDSAADWIRISEMLLGKVPDGFTFAPKHKSNAYDRAENG